MGAVIFFCRLFPFIFFSRDGSNSTFKEKFLVFIEKTAPPVAMTVLALREIATPIKDSLAANAQGAVILSISSSVALCAFLYLISKRNALVSILGSTALYMALRVFLV
jgi:branched-subunit amino acid transport protein AzlD